MLKCATFCPVAEEERVAVFEDERIFNVAFSLSKTIFESSETLLFSPERVTVYSYVSEFKNRTIESPLK